MAKATESTGRLQKLAKCFIITPYVDAGEPVTISLRVLPEITDSKAAVYLPEQIPGRSSPVVVFSHSDPRSINTELTFITATCQDIEDNLRYLRTIESLVYPGPPSGGAPYTPPVICKFVCGRLLGDGGVCVFLKSYSVRFPSEVAWDTDTYLPYKFTVSCSWEVAYGCGNLPTNCKIRQVSGVFTCPPSPVDSSYNIIPDYSACGGGYG